MCIKLNINIKYLSSLICLILALNPSYLISKEKDNIIWVTEHFEPYFIFDGPLKGKGISDRINTTLIKLLPEYQHSVQYMPILRITEALKNGEHIAVVSYLKNPNDKAFAQYSITSLVVPPLELTIREEDWIKNWHKQSPISLKAFINQGNIVGIAGRRYYGDHLYPLLFEKKEQLKKGVYAVQSTHYSSLAEMIVRNRIDGTIGYSAELQYFNYIKPQAIKLVSIPITENPENLFAYVVVPKSEWGSDFLKTLNSRLKKVRKTEEYQAIMFDWFGKKPAFEAALKKRFHSDQ